MRQEIFLLLKKAREGEKPALKKASQLATVWTEKEPENPLAFLLHGQVFSLFGQKEFALKSYLNAAKNYAKTGKLIQGIAALKLMLELDPENEKVRNLLAKWTTRGQHQKKKSVSIFPPTPLFSDLKSEALQDLVQRLERHNFSDQAFICKQGDAGDSIFVISQGKVAVLANPSGQSKAKELAVLEEGSFFGEFAYFTQQKRQASVQARGEVEVLELSRRTLESLVKTYPGVQEILAKFYQQRVLDMLIAQSKLFGSLPRKDRSALIAMFQSGRYPQKTMVLVEGDPGDTIYFIQKGEVEIFREKGTKKFSLAKLGPGEFFGELGFLHQHRRLASVQTLSPCVFLHLKRNQIEILLKKHPEVEKMLKMIAKERLKATKKSGALPAHFV